MNVPSRFVLAAAALLLLPLELPANAQAAKPLQVQETNIDGVNAEIVEAVRKEGVLTVKMRFRNGGSQLAKLKVTGDWRDVDTYYVIAGTTKFLILKDSQKIPLMNTLDNYGGLNVEVKPASSYLVWAKYPAPPADVKKFNLHTPHGPPFEDVPITESK
jgi:hypothetical protein